MAHLDELIGSGDFTLSVVGIGRVGLPLAISFADRGVSVFGVDRNEDHVRRVNSGELPFIEHGAGPVLQRVLRNGSFSATSDVGGAIAQSQVVVVTVGTPLTGDMRSDKSQIAAALETIGPALKPDSLVIMRSTVSPGTTNQLVVPTLTRHTGYEIGRDLFVAFCPERITEGRAMEELADLPEIIGGVDESSTKLAAAVFALLSPGKLIHKTDAMSAELAKLFSNVYRYVSFALANEYALVAEHYGRDAHEIIAILRDGYPRAPVPQPGFAGGPCLSKDGYFLIEELTFPDFVLTAWKLNESMPAHMVNRLDRAYQLRDDSLDGKRVAVLGLAFKADIDDDRMSPSLRLIDALERQHADVRAHDPHLPSETLDDALRDADAVILATNHAEYRDLTPSYVLGLVKRSCILVDCWSLFDRAEWEGAGFEVVTLGRG